MALDMYLKVSGISGESADTNHQDWIDISNYSWGANQSANMSSGSGGGSGKVKFTDLHVLAFMDKATPALIKYCSSGKHIPEVKVSMCKAGGTQIEYASTVLKDVLVTTANVSGAGTNQMIGMHYSFQGAQVEHHYWKQNSDGTKGAESQFMWDVKRNCSM